MWTSPEAPRLVDAAAVADEPDAKAWADTLDAAARLDLHGRTLTQLLRGEPVEVIDAGPIGWVKVVAPWQPTPDDPRGYPGWVRSAHLSARSASVVDPPGPPLTPVVPVERSTVLANARHFLGLRYLWGGTSPYGFDCSGLVHFCHRSAGMVVPRDAAAQQVAATPVPLGRERRGDLYFFASEGSVHHVGFVTDPGRMLHAPETPGGGLAGSGRIEEAPLSADRRAALVGAGRFLAE